MKANNTKIINELKSLVETFWLNDKYKSFNDIKNNLPISYEDVLDAEERLERFFPYLKKVFPDVIDGVIESPITKIDNMKNIIEKNYGEQIIGNLLLKRDDLLPIAGSIKARGGIYEVLKYAEELAVKNNLIKKGEDYSVFSESRFKEFFSNFTIQVGSTGNLGLSIGIISARLGFNVIVHMSSDAKKWKKQMLISNGVKVVEYSSDYSKAVEEGRELSNRDPKSYFIDDENSKDLFLGYAVGGMRVKKQLEKMNIFINKENPLYVYLPCGVGGGPGGITYGLKLAYGDDVQCYFAEPTHSPAMLLGLATGLHDKISVQDIGLDNKTIADGLAVGRPSSFVGKIMENLISGVFTIDDSKLFRFLADLVDSENIFVEPSATAGLLGPILLSKRNIQEKAVHLCWSTGGSLVPQDIRQQYYLEGKNLRNSYL